MTLCPTLIICFLCILLATRASCSDVPPEITARSQLPAKIQAREVRGFAGFLLDGGVYSPTYCNPGETWSTSSSYCGCMPTTSVGWIIATSCLGGSVLENPGQYTCPPEIPVCYTMSYFQDPSDTAPLRGYGCYITDTTLMIYKGTTVAAATAASSGPTNLFSVSPSSGGSTSQNPQFPLTPFSSTAVSQPSISPSTRKSSAWIAGPVVGAFVGGAFLVGLAFWIWSLHSRLARSQRNQRSAQVDTEKPQQGQQLSQAIPAAQPQELGGYQVVESPGDGLRAELPAR